MRRTLWGCALAAGALLTVTACSSDDTTSAYQTDKAAKGEVTADFYDEGSTRQTVVLYFAKSRQTKEITARIGEDDAWGIVLNEPDPKEASAGPDWAPAEPGGTGSRSSGG
ncbi:hypothetical protein [Streptomyces albicerus]|uniref:hypothetical protein n=1 Tax=Streptomyces albicerus TaxID=2569859 RepID=UPI00124B0B3C|nr:hypothetical protein [Streptomyces albicerus]